MNLVNDAIDCGTWREYHPMKFTLPYRRRPSIDGESIAGGWGRARGLTGGAFMGAMLAQQGGGLPDGAYEVQYIAAVGNSGGSYFSLGIMPGRSNTMEFSFKIQNYALSSYTAVGCTNAGSSGYYIGSGLANSTSVFRFLYLQNTSSSDADRSFQIPSSRITTGSVGWGFLTVNGQTVHPAQTGQQTSATPLLIGSRCSELHYWRIYDSGVLAMDLIPCVHNGSAELFDRVGRRFFQCTSGSFEAGPRV